MRTSNIKRKAKLKKASQSFLINSLTCWFHTNNVQRRPDRSFYRRRPRKRAIAYPLCIPFCPTLLKGAKRIFTAAPFRHLDQKRVDVLIRVLHYDPTLLRSKRLLWNINRVSSKTHWKIYLWEFYGISRASRFG